jgi:SRSO17 transposase
MDKPRAARPTIKFIDEYCASYRNLFPEVRSFEAFKHLHVGMLSPIKRKTLPEIAKAVGLQQEQALHHFLTKSPWSVQELRKQRLNLILQTLKGRKIFLIIDETGDQKKGKKTDYVNRQYLGKLGKIDNGIVAVTAWGLIDDITIPLIFEVFKPKERLKAQDTYRSKPEIAAQMVQTIKRMGFEIELVLADSLYGESESKFLGCLEDLKLDFAVAIRRNHGVWLPKRQTVRCNRWRKFNRTFSDGTQEVRYVREIIFGKKRSRRFWEITTEPETMPDNSTWYVMTEIPGLNYKDVGNLYGCRNWVEYGLNQSKNELGWADFRLTQYPDIEKWWEIVFSAYLLVSLFADSERNSEKPVTSISGSKVRELLREHPEWDKGNGWKNWLNNLRLISLPFFCFNLILPWLKVFPIPQLSLGFPRLIALMNFFPSPIPQPTSRVDYLFSSA